MEQTLVIVKPDGVQRGLVGEILSRYEDRGLRIAAAKFLAVPTDLAETHYAEHEDKPFYDDLVDFITSGPVLAAIIEGEDAIGVVRSMHGATDPTEAAPGTVRGDLGLDIQNNVVHGSDSAESAEREIKLWFDASEIVDWQRDAEDWVYQ